MSIHNETLLSGLALVTFLTHHQHTCIEFPSTLTIDTFRFDDLFRISVSVSVPVPVPAFRVFHLPYTTQVRSYYTTGIIQGLLNVFGTGRQFTGACSACCTSRTQGRLYYRCYTRCAQHVGTGMSALIRVPTTC